MPSKDGVGAGVPSDATGTTTDVVRSATAPLRSPQTPGAGGGKKHGRESRWGRGRRGMDDLSRRQRRGSSASGSTLSMSTLSLGDPQYTNRHNVDAEQALNTMGFGRFHFRLILVTGCFWAADSMQLLLLVFLGPSLSCEWGLTELQEAGVLMTAFASMGLGSVFWGNLADRRGRRVSLVAQCALTVVAGLCSAVAPSYLFMLASQALVGVAVGGSHVALSLYAECLPPAKRGWPLASASYGFAFGGVIQTLFAFVVLPTFDWRWLVALTSVLSAVPLALIPCLPESPRFHVAAGDLPRARATLAVIAKANQVRVPRSARPPSVEEVVMAGGGDDDGGEWGEVSAAERRRQEQLTSLGRFGDLCGASLRGFTRPLLLVWVGVSVSYLWQMFLASSLLASERLDVHYCAVDDAPSANTGQGAGGWTAGTRSCDGPSHDMLREVFLYSLAEIPGVALMTLLIALLDRRRALSFATLGSGITLLLLFACGGEVYVLGVLFIARGLAAASFQTVFIYTRDVFPSSLRATAVGLCNAVGRFAAVLLPHAAWFLDTRHVSVSILGAAAWCAATAATAFLLPRDWFAVSAGDTVQDAAARRSAGLGLPGDGGVGGPLGAYHDDGDDEGGGGVMGVNPLAAPAPGPAKRTGGFRGRLARLRTGGGGGSRGGASSGLELGMYSPVRTSRPGRGRRGVSALARASSRGSGSSHTLLGRQANDEDDEDGEFGLSSGSEGEHGVEDAVFARSLRGFGSDGEAEAPPSSSGGGLREELAAVRARLETLMASSGDIEAGATLDAGVGAGGGVGAGHGGGDRSGGSGRGHDARKADDVWNLAQRLKTVMALTAPAGEPGASDVDEADQAELAREYLKLRLLSRRLRRGGPRRLV